MGARAEFALWAEDSLLAGQRSIEPAARSKTPHVQRGGMNAVLGGEAVDALSTAIELRQ
jgi:hypothetical protein